MRQRMTAAAPEPRGCFNPHPARGGMRRRRHGATRSRRKGFNPHPARGGMRQRMTAAAPEPRGCFNPHPARGGMRPTLTPDPPHTLHCFNPHPARGGMRPHRTMLGAGLAAGFNPHPARGGMRHSVARSTGRVDVVSTLIPREAGCDTPHDAVPREARTVSTLIPREAGCDPDSPAGIPRHDLFQPSSRARRDATPQSRSRFGVQAGFQPSSRARRDATNDIAVPFDYNAIRFNPHPARGGMRLGRRSDHAITTVVVSTLIPREAGCDRALIGSRSKGSSFQPSSRARRDATDSGTVMGRLRTLFQPSSRARRDATSLLASRFPVTNMFQPSSRARRDATVATETIDRRARDVSTLIPREAGCDQDRGELSDATA